MNQGHHLARTWRAGLYPAACVLLVAGLGGCHHKRVTAVLPIGVLAPVDLEKPQAPETPPQIAEIPSPDFGPLPTWPAPTRAVPRKRPATKEENQPATQAAVENPPLALAIGSLSTGGEDDASNQQQVQDLIASIKKRIAALPAKVANMHRKEVRQVENFLDQAQKALKSGDTDGATNLATKARLLMDDLEKK